MRKKQIRIPLLLLALIFIWAGFDAQASNLAALSIKENIKMTEQNTDEKVKLENPSDAPLIFTEVVLTPQRREGSDKTSVSFSLTVKNQTNRRITGFAFTQKPKRGPVLEAQQNTTVEPNSTKTFLVQVMAREPANLTVAMTGVQFEDGTHWGTLQGLPGGKDGLLGKPQSSMLGSAQTVLMGKVQQGTILQGPQKDSLFDATRKDNLFGKTSGQNLFGTTQRSMLNAK